jgi:hypothetical protein
LSVCKTLKTVASHEGTDATKMTIRLKHSKVAADRQVALPDEDSLADIILYTGGQVRISAGLGAQSAIFDSECCQRN